MGSYLLPHERWFVSKAEISRSRAASRSPLIRATDAYYGPEGVRVTSAGVVDIFVSTVLILLAVTLELVTGLADPSLYSISLVPGLIGGLFALIGIARLLQGLRAAKAFRRCERTGSR